MAAVKSSGPATSVNEAAQGSVSHQGQAGAGAGGSGIGLGLGNLAVGGAGANLQGAGQLTEQALEQAAESLSANSANDNIEANTTISFGGNTGVF